ncbi:PP2C family protein-serine/threonine phosphatase [Kiloniella spongiae]|uniref:PP2C family protein-serine/threonine phosphatase n=1 Tax=Kiloniella spongiae TaxID=1489064 RepID=UPI00069A55C0|nr:fused response regulator/phosphatase [Kiloniella spongiae]
MEIVTNTGFSHGSKPEDQDEVSVKLVDIQSCKILIVDDELLIRELIKAQLSSVGFDTIDVAEDGLIGIQRIKDTKPDLVILDIQMPGMTGIEVLKQIRANPVYDDMPIIVETGHDDKEFRNEVLRAGATDIISKPIDFKLLRLRVRTHLEHRLLVTSLKSYQQRVEQELEAARSMQLQLLPRERDIQAIEEKYEVKLDWHYQASSELSGDCWGVHPISDTSFGIFIVDFTGHGVGAAVNTFRFHTVVKDLEPDAESPARYLEMLNDQLIDLIPRGQFATVNYSIIDVEKNTLTYASAGHTSPIMGCTEMNEVFLGTPDGLPIGIKKSIEFQDHEIAMNPDGFLLLYSDALIETPDDEATPLDDDGLVKLVYKTLSQSNEKRPLEDLLNSFYARSETAPNDDVTAIWIQR